MTGRTWVAGAQEDDHLSGSITFTPPSSCSSSNGFFPPGLQVAVYVNGNQVGFFASAATSSTPTPQTKNIVFQGAPFNFNGYANNGDLPPPGSPENRTLTVDIGDACDSSVTHYTVNSIAIDVGAVS